MIERNHFGLKSISSMQEILVVDTYLAEGHLSLEEPMYSTEAFLISEDCEVLGSCYDFC
jgi:hypothetical protein